MRYLLLDTCVIAGYYLPRSLRSSKAAERIEVVLDSIRTGGAPDLFPYIPNLCIAEAFSVFAKHAFGKWNNHVKKTIDTRVYGSLRKQFAADIHNGSLLYQYELSRYHVLATELVAPLDHYFQHTRNRTRKRNHRPMGTMDHLIVAMGIHLTHVHGAGNVVLVTSDDRLSNILRRCRSGISGETAKRLKLDVAEKITGKKFDPDLFPVPLNLKTATKGDLASALGGWPLPIVGKPKRYRYEA